jgi:iron complex outermembrane recepter protein
MGVEAAARVSAFGMARRAGVRRSRALGLLFPMLCQSIAAPAQAQLTENNAVTAAEDAFGSSVGEQRVGLYSPKDARGFNPQQSGNLRIEGLYYDQQTWDYGPCMVRDTAMRVGIAAQAYSFPSPTGIADLRLHVPDEAPSLSTSMYGGAYGQAGVLVEGKAPVSEHVSAGLCAGFYRNFLPDQERRDGALVAGSTWRWHPTERTEVVPFWSYIGGVSHEILPQVYADGVLPPPTYVARRLAAQDFTTFGYRMTTFGTLLRQGLSRDWSLAAGVFRSRENDPQAYDEEYLLQPQRTADHVLDVVPPFTAASTSGELRLARRFGGAVHEQTLEFTIRGRSADRNFGGDFLYDYGTVSLDSGPPPPQAIVFATHAPKVDETRQLDVGAMLEERWKGVGSLALGLIRSRYRRTVIDPDPAAAKQPATSASPTLASARFTVDAGKRLLFYGSFVQGLEDSALAPSSATNFGEPPPATRTHQVDGGLRYAPTDELSLIAGLFDIYKVYFNVDKNNLYTALGNIRHRGLETSLTYADHGLTLIGGGVWLRPHVDYTRAESASSGVSPPGSVPPGPVPVTLTLSVDYAPSNWHRWAASLQWTWLSSRVATLDDHYRLAPLTTLGAGVRYASRLGKHPWSLRLDGLNLTNTVGLHLSNVGVVTPELGRRFMVTFAMDT